jgi:D-alanyl-D-alanine carboxypeptidase
MKTLAACLLALPMLIVCSSAQELTSRTGSPYLGAIVTDAETGEVLFEDKADAQGYPASVIKLMDLLIVLDYVEQGALSFGDQIKEIGRASCRERVKFSRST